MMASFLPGVVLLRLHLRAVEHAGAVARVLGARARPLFREQPADDLPRRRHRGGARRRASSSSRLMSVFMLVLTCAQLENEARLAMPPKLIALIVKELLSAFRDPRTRIAFIMPPLMQVFLYAYAATLEVTNAPIGVFNEDWGESSRQLISRFERASAFSHDNLLQERKRNPARDRCAARAGRGRIPQDFSRQCGGARAVGVQVLLDGRRSNSAQILNSYINTIVTQFAVDVLLGGGAARNERRGGSDLVQSQPRVPKYHGAGPCRHPDHDDGADGDGDVGRARARARHVRAAARVAACSRSRS